MNKIPAIVHNAGYLFEPGILNFDSLVEIHANRFSNNPRPINTYVEHIPTWPDYPQIPIPFGTDPHGEGGTQPSYKVFINSTEPESERGIRETIELVIANHEKYDLILTTDKETLNNCNNAVLFPYGTTWIGKKLTPDLQSLCVYDESTDSHLHDNKRFEVSFLMTRHCTENISGYDVRQKLWMNQELINIPKLFYNSYLYGLFDGSYSDIGLEDAQKNILPEGDKKLLFNSQFHIVIESLSIENYFTEKLIDALITKTVPIYCGCPNIGDFFDTRGMIIIDNKIPHMNKKEFINQKLDIVRGNPAITNAEVFSLQNHPGKDIIKSCNKLNQNSYEEMLPFIEENYKRAKQYSGSLAKRVKEEIEKRINT